MKTSLNAKLVAKDVISKVRKGEKIRYGEIIRKRGYKKSISLQPTKVTETASYKAEMDPFIQAMLKERDMAIKRMSKVRSKAKYRDLTDSIDKLTKNIQLLNGGKTSNDEVVMRWGK